MRHRSEGTPPAAFRIQTVARLNAVMERRAHAYGDTLRRSWRRVLGKVGTGRAYRYKGKAYRASLAGQPPAIRTGYLSHSPDVTVETFEERGRGFRGVVRLETHAFYGKFLDPTLVGGEPSGRAGERPILEPVMDDARPELLRLSRTMRS